MPSPSQVRRNSARGARPARATPTFSKPSSRALALMSAALLIVVVHEAAGGAELVALVLGVALGPPVLRHALVADRPLPREQPENQVDQRRRPEHADGEEDVPRPEH